jgi:hypothetical protein
MARAGIEPATHGFSVLDGQFRRGGPSSGKFWQVLASLLFLSRRVHVSTAENVHVLGRPVKFRANSRL